MFELDQSDNEDLISASITEDGNFSGQDLSEWLKNVEDFLGDHLSFVPKKSKIVYIGKYPLFWIPYLVQIWMIILPQIKQVIHLGDSHENTNEAR